MIIKKKNFILYNFQIAAKEFCRQLSKINSLRCLNILSVSQF